MIVSASYRTDIPAFYGAWFAARLAAGAAQVRNPYGGPDYTVRLDRESVAGFVFWTRNLAPFLPQLDLVRRRGDPFVVQYTIVGYPRALDRAVPPPPRAVAAFRAAAAAHGPDALVWRYDPIFLTSLTPPAWHRERFARLADGLAGATDEVVVSFAQLYRKSRRNLAAAAARHGFAWDEAAAVDTAARAELALQLAETAAARGMRLTLCTQPELAAAGFAAARCIDAARLSRVAGRAIAAPQRGNRSGCLCHRSRDIGAYDTCPHGCAYCYAVASPAAARQRHRAHDAGADRLGAPAAGPDGT